MAKFPLLENIFNIILHEDYETYKSWSRFHITKSSTKQNKLYRVFAISENIDFILKIVF